VLDLLLLFRHSQHADEELRYALRSVARYVQSVGKVWILGNRPAWLTEDRRVVEHVDHSYVARPFRFKLPVRSHYLLTLLGSVIPDMTNEFLWMADDNVFLAPASLEFLRKVRPLEDLSKLTTRGKGIWKDALWRTYDTLRRLEYPALNYESHIPHVMTRKWVWESYCEFENFVSEDRNFGLLALTSIFNYRMKHEPFELTWLLDEGKFLGLYKHGITGLKPANKLPGITGPELQIEQLRQLAADKTFLNFDDQSFTPAVRQFLEETFPEKSRFER
jgi:hypothetical protein